MNSSVPVPEEIMSKEGSVNECMDVEGTSQYFTPDEGPNTEQQNEDTNEETSDTTHVKTEPNLDSEMNEQGIDDVTVEDSEQAVKKFKVEALKLEGLKEDPEVKDEKMKVEPKNEDPELSSVQESVVKMEVDEIEIKKETTTEPDAPQVPDIGLVAQIEAAIAQASTKSIEETANKPPTNDIVELLDDDDDDEAPPTSTSTENMSETPHVNGNIKKISDINLTHDCINPKCENNSNDFIQAPLFIINFFIGGQNANKPGKRRHVCSPCYDIAVEKYREYCNALVNKQPLLKMEIPVR